METWTQNELTALKAALARGVLRVKYRDREVTYRTQEEMLQLVDIIERRLAGTGTSSGRRVASFRKGTS